MPGVPWSPGEDGKRENKGSDDSGKRSAADPAFPVLTILHF
jgi:hypothetical protein